MSAIVLFGGDGSEHRVSVASAQNVASLLEEAEFWYWTRRGAVWVVSRDDLLTFERPFERDFLPSVQSEWTSLELALDAAVGTDAVFFLALHGGSGEDGTVQNLLEERRISFTGSDAASSQLAFDKLRAREAVTSEGIRVADATVVTADSATHERAAHLFERHGTIVMKPVADGSSHGIHFIRLRDRSQRCHREVPTRAPRPATSPKRSYPGASSPSASSTSRTARHHFPAPKFVWRPAGRSTSKANTSARERKRSRPRTCRPRSPPPRVPSR